MKTGSDGSAAGEGGGWTTRKFWKALLLIAALAFAGRVAYILVETRDGLASPDELYYRDAAELLANGDGFVSPPIFGTPGLPIAEHPPLTILVLAPASALTDGNELAMRITVALAGAGVVVLVGLLAREVAGPRAGVLAAITAAVYPNLFANDGLLMAETFATLGTAAALLFTYRFIRSPTWINAAGIGVSCAVAMLSRSELALLLPILIVPVLTRRSRWRERLRRAGVVVLAAAIPVAPWVAYNLSRFEEPVVLSHGEGGVLLGANCDDTYAGPHLGSWFGLCALSESEPIEDHSVDAADKRDRAVEYIEDHLGRLPVVAAARVGRLWSAFRPFQSSLTSDGEYRQRWVSRAGWVMYWVLLAFAVAGAVIMRRRQVPLLPLLAPAIVMTIVAALFYGNVRFRAPVEVSFVVLAAVVFDAISAGREVLVDRPHRAGPFADRGGDPLQ